MPEWSKERRIQVPPTPSLVLKCAHTGNAAVWACSGRPGATGKIVHAPQTSHMFGLHAQALLASFFACCRGQPHAVSSTVFKPANQLSHTSCATASQALPGSCINPLVNTVLLDRSIKQSRACRCMSLSSRSSGYQFCARLCQPGLGRASAANDDDNSPTPGDYEPFVLCK